MSAQQSLLYSLRSTTTSLPVKLATAKSAALVDSPSPVVHQVVRDWILQDLFLRSRTHKDESTLLSTEWWSLLSQVVDTAQGISSTPSLPIFVSLFASYSAAEAGAGASPELLCAVAKVWSKVGGGAMRKATVDAALEGYASLLKSSVAVLERAGPDVEAWEELAESWLKAFRGVVDAGKGGKKIPLHTLANLSSIIPLLSILSPTSSLYDSLLLTVQFSLFNVDNLRRGIARESYNAGGGLNPTDKDDLESASGELLSALRTCITNAPASEQHVLHALPLLFTLYRTSLATHSATLFPLPARTSFPTASAALSASEIHSLQKRRALAAGWLKGVAVLLGWKEAGWEDGDKAACLWKTVEEVESGDLFRDARGEGWEGVLESLVDGSVLRLSTLTPSSTSSRESLIGLLGSIMRLSFPAVSPSLPSILTSLSSTPSPTPSPSTTTFLSALLTHHTRSLLLPSLLLLLSTALAAPTSVPNNLLTTHTWTTELRTALGGLVGTSTKSCWDALVAAIDEALRPAFEEGEGERSKKRRRMSGTGAAARIGVLTLLVQAVPVPLPVAQFDEFRNRFVDPAVGEVAKGKGGVGIELLATRYAMLERMRREGVEGGEEWSVGEKRRKGLVGLLGSEEGQVVLEVARTLLQSIVPSTPVEVAQTILASLLARITTTDKAESAWNGHVQGVKGSEIPAALWELVSRRWLTVFEQFGSSEQHAEIAQLVVGSMVPSSGEELITIDAITARLLRRADFYELRQLQTHVQVAVLARITIPGLSPSSEILAALSAKKVPKPLRSLAISTVSSTIASFDRVASLLPMEYVGKALRNDLIDRAVGLDIWVSGGKVELEGEELAKAQFVLRKFVVLAAAEGSSLTEGPAILSHLVKSTSNVSPAHLQVSIELYKHFTKSAIASYKSEKNVTALVAYLEAFGTPLADLAKRCKKGLTSLTCEELAFLSLCDTLASTLGEFKSLPAPLVDAIRVAAKSASKPFAKALASTTAALESDASAVHRISDMLNACRSLWRLKDWISEGADHDQVELYSTFAQSVLAHLAAAPATDDFVARLAMLDLLAFRVIRLRAISDSLKVSTLPFETFLACHLTFRQSLDTTDAASAALEENLRRATSSATLREYTAALDDIAGAVAVAVAPESTATSLEPALDIALVLLRDGPEGSSRLSSACLSELLRHLSFFLLRHTSPTSTTEASSGEPVAKAFLVVAKFLEGICGDRPMLLSRQNVSSVLALVSRMLQPSGSTLAEPLSETSYVPTSSAVSSTLFLSLVSIVAHLVRHRKDHITPLFPHLVSTLASFLSALRRAGFGTTGSSRTFEDADAGLALGRRAQREARATFPFWVWDGGAKGISRNEAKAVGRLLASLTTKTATTLKRKHGAKDKDNLTISLSAPLSKHAPFVILPYLRACVHAISPIPSALRAELQGGWFEVMDVMGKWEREALMKGFLRDDEEAERGVLRGMWRTWEKERYRG